MTEQDIGQEDSGVESFIQFMRELQGREEVSPAELSNEQLLNTVRPRMEDGSLPKLFTTDLEEGWCHYARHSISAHMARAERQVGKIMARRYVPTLAELAEGAKPQWGDTEEIVKLNVLHAERRIERLIGATRRHGTVLVAEGATTVQEGRLRAHQTVDWVWDAIELETGRWVAPEAA